MRISDWSSDVCSSDLRHLTPDGEVAGIAAKLTFGERSSLVAFDRRGVIAEPFGQIGACFDKPPGHACARGAGRKGGSALHCVGHGYDENRTGKFCISHNVAMMRFSLSDRRERTSLWARLQIGRAHVCTPVTNAPLVCRLLIEKK